MQQKKVTGVLFFLLNLEIYTIIPLYRKNI